MPVGVYFRPAPSPRRSAAAVYGRGRREAAARIAGRAQPPTQRQVFAERWPPRQGAFGLSAAVYVGRGSCDPPGSPSRALGGTYQGPLDSAADTLGR